MAEHGPCRQLLELLAVIHNEAKAIYILAEELEFDDFLSFIQPVREQRDAHEHVMRSVASSLGHGKHANDAEYQQSCLKAAVSHEIRCFFDCCDWLSVLLRKGIRERLVPYSHDCIRTVLPDYYSVLRPRIDQISTGIAEARRTKDGSDISSAREEIFSYKGLLDELQGTFKRVSAAASALEEFTRNEKARELDTRKQEQAKTVSERKWSLATKVIAGLIVAAIVCSVSFAASWLWNRVGRPLL